MPMRDILEIAAALYLVVQFGVFTILAMAGRNVQPDHRGWADRLARSLAAVGSLGRTEPVDDSGEIVVAASPRQRGGGQCLAPRRHLAAAGAAEPPLEVDPSGASPGGQPLCAGARRASLRRPRSRRAAARRPSSRTGDRSPPPAPAVRPVCTGEVWMMVLRGATSQWKRSRGDSRPSAPARGAAGADGIDRAEGGADRVDVGARVERQRRGSSSSIRASRKSVASQETITPTLTNSPRSTRGTTRTIGVVIGVHRGHGRPP